MSSQCSNVMWTLLFIYLKSQTIAALPIQNENEASQQSVLITAGLQSDSFYDISLLRRTRDSYGNPLFEDFKNFDSGDNGKKKLVQANGYLFEIPNYASGIRDIMPPPDELLPPLNNANKQSPPAKHNNGIYQNILPELPTNPYLQEQQDSLSVDSNKKPTSNQPNTRDYNEVSRRKLKAIHNESNTKNLLSIFFTDNENIPRSLSSFLTYPEYITSPIENNDSHHNTNSSCITESSRQPLFIILIANDISNLNSSLTQLPISLQPLLSSQSANISPKSNNIDYSKSATLVPIKISLVTQPISSDLFETEAKNSLHLLNDKVPILPLFSTNKNQEKTDNPLDYTDFETMINSAPHSDDKTLEPSSKSEPSKSATRFETLGENLTTESYSSITDDKYSETGLPPNMRTPNPPKQNKQPATSHGTLRSTPSTTHTTSHQAITEPHTDLLPPLQETTTPKTTITTKPVISSRNSLGNSNIPTSNIKNATPLKSTSAFTSTTDTSANSISTQTPESSANHYDNGIPQTSLSLNTEISDNLTTEPSSVTDDKYSETGLPPNMRTPNPPKQDKQPATSHGTLRSTPSTTHTTSHQAITEPHTDLLPPLQETTTPKTSITTKRPISSPDQSSNGTPPFSENSSTEVPKSTHGHIGTQKPLNNAFPHHLLPGIFQVKTSGQTTSTTAAYQGTEEKASPPSFTTNSSPSFVPLTKELNKIPYQSDPARSIFGNDFVGSVSKEPQNVHKYTGGFNGAAGILGEQKMPGYAIKLEGSAQNHEHKHHPMPVVPTSEYPNSANKNGKYTGGFGGPPGILAPYDSSRN